MAELFTVRLAAVIRTTILQNARTRYLALEKDLDISKDSDAYNWADVLSIELEGIEAKALALTHEIFPDTSSETYLLKHGDLIGLTRKAATSSVLACTATGTPASTWATTDLLAAPNGQKYAPTSGGTIGGGGSASLTVQAAGTGVITNQVDGTLLTWATPPAGINTTATINSTTTIAADIETLADFAQRILDWWRDRPGAGNNADFRAWAESRSGVDQAYVYPLDHPIFGAGTLGCTIVSIQGDAAQRSVSAPLGVTGGNVTDVLDYILGTGVYAGTGKQLPSFVDPDDITVEIPTTDNQNVVATIVLGTGYSWPFAGTFTKAANAGNTTTRIYVTASPVGTVNVGDLVAIDTTSTGFPRGSERGAYQVRTISVVNSAYLEVSEALGNVPNDGKLIRPAPDNWIAMRDAVIGVFDRLGPLDESNPKSARFPVTTTIGPSRLYHSALEACLMSLPGLSGAPAAVGGVVSASVTIPAANADPSAVRRQLAPMAIYFVQ